MGLVAKHGINKIPPPPHPTACTSCTSASSLASHLLHLSSASACPPLLRLLRRYGAEAKDKWAGLLSAAMLKHLRIEQTWGQASQAPSLASS